MLVTLGLRAASLAAFSARLRCREHHAPKESRRGADLALAPMLVPAGVDALAHAAPEFIINDAQLWQAGRLPFLSGALCPLAPPGIRIFDPLRSVPDVLPHIHRVIQDA